MEDSEAEGVRDVLLPKSTIQQTPFRLRELRIQCSVPQGSRDALRLGASRAVGLPSCRDRGVM